jgi:hypothetical protein
LETIGKISLKIFWNYCFASFQARFTQLFEGSNCHFVFDMKSTVNME